jgi:hypothetical protein
MGSRTSWELGNDEDTRYKDVKKKTSTTSWTHVSVYIYLGVPIAVVEMYQI